MHLPEPDKIKLKLPRAQQGDRTGLVAFFGKSPLSQSAERAKVHVYLPYRGAISFYVYIVPLGLISIFLYV